ncbi:MAG TPA: polysaccharide biosynthesis C-terminal domain-containing protein [Conexibacter sp.]|nr:polysaccharide biosynthesis C-terminal domain-containing protein [Conexibacter sp.]
MTAQSEPPPRPLTGGAVMSAASRVTVAVTGAAATILIARLLGPDGSGGYVIAQTLIALLTVATTLGVEHGIAYYVSSGRWAAPSAYRSARRVALVTGVAGAGLGVLARLLIPAAFGGLSVATTAVAAGALPFVLSWFYFTYVALAIDRYEAYALPPALQSAAALVLVAVLGTTLDLPGAVLGFSLAHVVTALAVGVAARRTVSRASSATAGLAEQPGQLRRAIRFGVKGYAANALQFANYRLDVFVLAGVASTAAVGQYSIAVATTSVMWLLPRSLADVLFPRIAALSARADGASEEARAFVETKSLRHTIVIVASSTVALALALVLLIVPVYGAAFRPAIDLGLILLPGVALLAVSGTLSASFVGRGHPGYALAITLVTTPLTLVLYVLLIPPLHATGAALASTISYSATFVLCAVFYRRVTHAPVLSRLVPTRSELADYRALAPAIAAWWRGLRARRSPARNGL